MTPPEKLPTAEKAAEELRELTEQAKRQENPEILKQIADKIEAARTQIGDGTREAMAVLGKQIQSTKDALSDQLKRNPEIAKRIESVTDWTYRRMVDLLGSTKDVPKTFMEKMGDWFSKGVDFLSNNKQLITLLGLFGWKVGLPEQPQPNPSAPNSSAIPVVPAPAK